MRSSRPPNLLICNFPAREERRSLPHHVTAARRTIGVQIVRDNAMLKTSRQEAKEVHQANMSMSNNRYDPADNRNYLYVIQ